MIINVNCFVFMSTLLLFFSCQTLFLFRSQTHKILQLFLLHLQFCRSLLSLTSISCLDKYLGEDTKSDAEDGRHEEMIKVGGHRPEDDEHGGEAVPRLDGGQLLHGVDVD